MTWLPPYSGSSSVKVLGVKVWGRTWLSRWFARPISAFRRRWINAPYYWFYYRFTQSGRECWMPKGLRPGYRDCDSIMLDSCFGLLRRYVEDEMGGAEAVEEFNEGLRKPGADGYGPEGHCARQAGRQQEALDLWRWWTQERPVKLAEIERLTMQAYRIRGGIKTRPVNVGGAELYEMLPVGEDVQAIYEKVWRLEEELRDETQRNLHRLIDIREGLWT
jgi:hypothetical protein